LYSICSIPEILERNFCDGLEMKFAPGLGGMQQVDAVETAAESVIACFYLRLVITSAEIQVCRLAYFNITNIHMELKPQAKVSYDMNSPAFTLYTTFY